MNHWDMIPGEIVVLRADDRRIEATFLFRDTVHACFTVESTERKWLELDLHDEGGLTSTVEVVGDYQTGRRRRKWTINLPLGSTAPPRENSRYLARMNNQATMDVF